ncbi:GTP pyrophosphokinase [Bacillus cereus]|nr:GTP pyrophosphokinase [Bacillus cereus]
MLPDYIKIAYEIAQKAHAGQVDKAGMDYIKHPEAVQVLTKEKYTPYFEYLSRVKENSLARTVKLADLKHNSDRSRLARITDKDLKRLEKYRKAIQFLEE